MLDAAFIVLRELCELFLIVLALARCTAEQQQNNLLRFAGAGLIVGLLAAAAGIGFVSRDFTPPYFKAGVTIFIGLVSLALALSILFSRDSIQSHVDSVLSHLLSSPASRLYVAVFCAVAAARESFEVGIFFLSSSAAPDDLATGAALGASLAVLIMLGCRSLAHHGRLMALYRWSTLLLCFLSVKLILGGVAELFALLVSPGDASAARHPVIGAIGTNGVAFLFTLWPALIYLRRWWREAASS